MQPQQPAQLAAPQPQPALPAPFTTNDDIVDAATPIRIVTQKAIITVADAVTAEANDKYEWVTEHDLELRHKAFKGCGARAHAGRAHVKKL